MRQTGSDTNQRVVRDLMFSPQILIFSHKRGGISEWHLLKQKKTHYQTVNDEKAHIYTPRNGKCKGHLK